MIYPVWEPAIANSILIAIIAIPHVFVSHFAIGGGLYLVLAESWARRHKDQDHLNYIQKHSRFFVLLTLVFGAVTGVGIWVTIGLIHPTGTKWLINNFVWGWATEWVFFFLEITAAIMYYYGWKRLAPKMHLAIGWIYFIAAWMSLFVINGILSFMLTPGGWLQSGNFWQGFFNPTFWPALVFRTFISLTLAGLYATFTISREKNRDLKTRIMRRNAVFVIGSIILAIPAGLWYFGLIPAEAKAAIMPGMVPSIAIQVMLFASGILLVLSLLQMVIFPRNSGYISAGVLLLCGFLAMGGFEWARESVRKPFIIYNYLYSNNFTVNDVTATPSETALPIAYTSGDRGHDLYLIGCRSCHTESCYNSLADKLAGLDEEHLVNIVPRLQYFIGKMPPFPGNEEDARSLAQYLKRLAAPDPLTTRSELIQGDKAEIVFKRRCGGCHTMTGFRALGDTFEGMDPEEAEEVILMLQDLTEAMPPFTGDDQEQQLLVHYLTGAGK